MSKKQSENFTISVKQPEPGLSITQLPLPPPAYPSNSGDQNQNNQTSNPSLIKSSSILASPEKQAENIGNEELDIEAILKQKVNLGDDEEENKIVSKNIKDTLNKQKLRCMCRHN